MIHMVLPINMSPNPLGNYMEQRKNMLGTMFLCCSHTVSQWFGRHVNWEDEAFQFLLAVSQPKVATPQGWRLCFHLECHPLK